MIAKIALTKIHFQKIHLFAKIGPGGGGNTGRLQFYVRLRIDETEDQVSGFLAEELESTER